MRSTAAHALVAAATVFSATALAHGGHDVPPGISAHFHLHLFDGVLVTPGWLLMIGVPVLVAIVVVRRARRQRPQPNAEHERRTAARA